MVKNARIYAYMRAYARICSCVASRKCDDAAATLKLGHLVTPGPFLSDAAASHPNATPAAPWDALPPVTVAPTVFGFFASHERKNWDANLIFYWPHILSAVGPGIFKK